MTRGSVFFSSLGPSNRLLLHVASPYFEELFLMDTPQRTIGKLAIHHTTDEAVEVDLDDR